MTAWNNRSSQELRVSMSAGAEINIGIKSSSVWWTTLPRAPEDVSMSSRAGQSRSISETAPSPASTGSDLVTTLISPIASLSRLLARAEPLQPYAWARNLDLKAHLCEPFTGQTPPDPQPGGHGRLSPKPFPQLRPTPPCPRSLNRNSERLP